MRDLAVFIPTRGRPANIRKVISAWDFTNAWDDADMVLVIDADDPEYQGYLDIASEFRDKITVWSEDVWVPMVHKLDRAAVGLASGWFALGFAGDDHLPQTINWAKTYLAALHELETGLVHSDDGYQHDNICTEWAVTADVVRVLGRMIPAPVEHMYSDVSLHEVMAEAGALRYLPQVRIEHMHPIVKKAATDEQYQRVNSREQFARDKREYDWWVREQKAADLAAIRALRPDRIQPVRRGQVLRSRPISTPAQHRSGPSRRKERPVATKFPYPFSQELQHVRGATPDEIAMTLADFAIRVPADQEIVELGVFQGRTALVMAWGAKQGHGAHVTAIDAWDLEGNTYGPPFNQAESQARAHYWITQLGYRDRITLVKNFASDAAAVWMTGCGLANKPVGLLFVDDDHDYSGARRAVEDWAPHLAEGAVIAIDDYGHPDWPGVKMAVDDLVNEGVLAPIEIFHERLAVTRLLTNPACSEPGHDHTASSCQGPLAITSEGVSPSPYPAVAGQVAADPVNTESGPPEGWVQAADGSWAEPTWNPIDDTNPVNYESDPVDAGVSTVHPSIDRDREVAHAGELAGVDAGTPIGELTIPQLKILARKRNIVLGARKDKRDDILQALKDGR